MKSLEVQKGYTISKKPETRIRKSTMEGGSNFLLNPKWNQIN